MPPGPIGADFGEDAQICRWIVRNTNVTGCRKLAGGGDSGDFQGQPGGYGRKTS
jgi:hypothetical protein